jgi:hypothetical protein
MGYIYHDYIPSVTKTNKYGEYKFITTPNTKSHATYIKSLHSMELPPRPTPPNIYFSQMAFR